MLTEESLRAQVREIVLRILNEDGLSNPAAVPGRSVALGCDHGGFQLKQHIRQFLAERNYHLIDCGTFDESAVDYPDFAYAVAKLVSDGEAWRGIVIDGAGIGSCMAANKVPGVRAAMCYDVTTARNAREHNDANVLSLGGKLIALEVAREMVHVFLTIECREPRHQKRVEKIMQIERRFLRK